MRNAFNRVIAYIDSVLARDFLTKEEKDILRYAKNILVNGASMAIGDNFATKLLFLIPLLLSKLNSDKDHMAAYGLTTTMISLLLILTFSPLYFHGFSAGAHFDNFDESNEDQREQKRKAIALVIRNGLVYSVPMTMLSALPFIFSRAIFTDWFGQSERVAEIAESFLRPFALSIPGIFSAFLLTAPLIAAGRTRVFLVSPVILAFCLFLSGALAFGRYRLPELGLTGALMGCILEPYLDALYKFYSLFLSAHFRKYELLRVVKENFRRDLSGVLKLVINGSAISAQVAEDYSVPFFLLLLSHKLGETAQAACAIAFLFQSICALFNIFCAVAGSIAVGGEINNVEKVFSEAPKAIAVKIPLVISASAGAVLPILFSVQPGIAMLITHNDDRSVKEQLESIAPYVALAAWLNAIAFQLAFLSRAWYLPRNQDHPLSAYDKYWKAVGLRLIGNGLGFGIGVFATFFWSLGIQGIGLSCLLAEVFSIIAL